VALPDEFAADGFARGNERMVKIRMMRIGSNNNPFYRVIAIDERKPRNGRPLEFLGTYDPTVNPPALKLDLESIDRWVAKGAQFSSTVGSLVRQLRRSAGAAVNG
jgi:small subunit ribosomal protein S16